MAKLRIKDTGQNTDSGSVIYTQVNSGSWFDLTGFSFIAEFTTLTSDHQTQVVESGLFTFSPNDMVGIQAPRFTIQGLVESSNTSLIQNIIKLNRTLGVKRISGGSGIISALPESATDTYTYVPVIVKNITLSDVVRNGVDYVSMTIQLEQVK